MAKDAAAVGFLQEEYTTGISLTINLQIEMNPFKTKALFIGKDCNIDDFP